MPSSPCPCGAGAAADACCAPLHRGAPAPTALALMRSRYAAYVLGEIDYLLATHAAATRGAVDVEAVRAWSRDTAWRGLEILATDGGGPDDATGIVEFVARGVTRGAPFAQRERSRFVRQDGRWAYLDGEAARAPESAAPRAGRNAPCPCGSGKKHKRCCGA